MRRAGDDGWRKFRDRAGMLLYGGVPGASRAHTPPPGLERQHEMYARLVKGDQK